MALGGQEYNVRGLGGQNMREKLMSKVEGGKTIGREDCDDCFLTQNSFNSDIISFYRPFSS